MGPGNLVVFLRGVNVNGITVRSADLRATLASVPGIEGVATVGASGNAVVQTSLRAARLKSDAEAALRTAFGYEAFVVVLAQEAVGEILRASPFPGDLPDVHTYATLWSDADACAHLLAAAATLDRPQPVDLGDGVLIWTCPRGASTTDPLARLLARPRYRSASTTRTLQTLDRVFRARP